MKVYVAGPLGFNLPGRDYYYGALLPALRGSGLEPLDPWSQGEWFEHAGAIEDPVLRRAAFAEANRRAGERNALLIGECAAVFAVLDGADVDSGTAAEVGWAAALGRPIVGWRSDFRKGSDNEAAVVNLQVQYFVERTGGNIVDDMDEAIRLLRLLLQR